MRSSTSNSAGVAGCEVEVCSDGNVVLCLVVREGSRSRLGEHVVSCDKSANRESRVRDERIWGPGNNVDSASTIGIGDQGE
jgi:hypothetical protein